jgi:hypothetical protein
MFIILITLGALSAAAVIGALVVTARDGYRRLPRRGAH